jgi:hypothetical protein
MKRVIIPLLMVFVGPTLTSAQQVLLATSGSMIDSGDLVPYSAAGSGFSTSGVIDFQSGIPQNPVPGLFGPGNIGGLIFYGDLQNPNLDNFAFALHGVAWAAPTDVVDGGNAIAEFQLAPDLLVAGPGNYSSTFTFSGSFTGAPASLVSANPTAGCDQLACRTFVINGSGSAMVAVIPAPGFPGSFEISKVTMTFAAAEPSTASLLLLAVGAFGLQAWGRVRRERRR